MIKFEELELEVIKFETEDVITTSCTGTGDTCSFPADVH